MGSERTSKNIASPPYAFGGGETEAQPGQLTQPRALTAPSAVVPLGRGPCLSPARWTEPQLVLGASTYGGRGHQQLGCLRGIQEGTWLVLHLRERVVTFRVCSHRIGIWTEYKQNHLRSNINNFTQTALRGARAPRSLLSAAPAAHL